LSLLPLQFDDAPAAKVAGNKSQFKWRPSMRGQNAGRFLAFHLLVFLQIFRFSDLGLLLSFAFLPPFFVSAHL